MVKKEREKSKKARKRSLRDVDKSVRKDFEVFAKGVERLEELRNELNNLHTSGYEDEILSIKSKLKNVSYIPEIEKELVDLKAKIRGTYKPKKKINKAHIAIHRKINEIKKQIPAEHSKIHRKIEELKESVPDKEQINRKLKELEEEIEEKGREEQLLKKDMKFAREVPKIKDELDSFKNFLEELKKEEQRKKEMLTKIDPEVNLLVNDKFNLTLNEVKVELSKKLKNKELDIQKQLQKDLEERKKKFAKQYKELENEFDKKYKEQVKLSLDREVKAKFNNILDERVNKIGKRLSSELKSEEIELKSAIASKEKALEEEGKKLYNELNKKRGVLEREYKGNLDKEKKMLKKHSEEEVLIHRALLDKKMHEHLTLKTKEVHEKYKKMHEHLTLKTKEVHEKYKKMQQKELEKMKKIDEEQKKLKTERQNYKEIILENIADEEKKMQQKELEKMEELKSKAKIIKYEEEKYKTELMNKFEKQRHEETNKLKKQKQQEIEETVKKQSKIIREQLKKEFDQKLKLEINAKNAEFEKKKSDLVLEIQNKAKKLFV